MLPYHTADAPKATRSRDQVTPLDETIARRLGHHAAAMTKNPRRMLGYIGDRVSWHSRNNPLKRWLIFQLVHLHGHRRTRFPADHAEEPLARLLVRARRMAVRYINRECHQNPADGGLSGRAALP